MNEWKTFALRRFLSDESGSEMVEFALVLAVFTAAAIAALSAFAITTSSRQTATQNSLTNAALNPL